MSEMSKKGPSYPEYLLQRYSFPTFGWIVGTALNLERLEADAFNQKGRK